MYPHDSRGFEGSPRRTPGTDQGHFQGTARSFSSVTAAADVDSSLLGKGGGKDPGMMVVCGSLKKRSGRLNTWSDRHFVLRTNTLEYFSKPSDAAPKGSFELHPACTVSAVKEMKTTSGKVLFTIRLAWPLPNHPEDGDIKEEDKKNSSGGADPDIYVPPPTSPAVAAYSHHNANAGPASIDRSWSNASAMSTASAPPRLGPHDAEGLHKRGSGGARHGRSMLRRQSAANEAGGTCVMLQKRPDNPTAKEETHNETIQGLVNAQNESRTRFVTIKEQMEQLKERELSEKKKEEEKEKKKYHKQAATAAVAGSALLTLGVVTGGLGLVGGLLAMGVTTGAAGKLGYEKYKDKKAVPKPILLASDKLSVIEQWRGAVETQIKALKQEQAKSIFSGHALTGDGGDMADFPAPALEATDLRTASILLSQTRWMSGDVIHGLRIFEEDDQPPNGQHKEYQVRPRLGRATTGLPWMKAQALVRATPLETFMALLAAPRVTMNGVVQNVTVIETIDDHSDVVHVSVRPIWLSPSWTAPRDFCLARYWCMAAGGSYMLFLDSTVHDACPPFVDHVRGELHAVYTISPRKGDVPGADASAECLLAAHMQVDPRGWVWEQFGYKKLYASRLLVHVLEVRDVIEVERFMAVGDVAQHALPPLQLGETNLAEHTGGGEGGPEDAEGATTLDRGSTVKQSMWAEADGTQFQVRGPAYTVDRLKVLSAKQMFRLRAVDLFELPSPATHLASHPSNRVQLARKAGERDFVWVLHMMVPGPPHYAFLCYFTPNGGDEWLDPGTPFGRLAEPLFYGQDDNFRDQRLKIIPKIVEGNWVVKRACGTTPAILGTKLKQHHFQGDNYLETDLEIGSSSVAANITRLCTGYAKSLTVDIVWTIQGNTQEELPEVILGGVRLNQLDLLTAKPFDPTSMD